jgi:AcrR family transcriptional regulator
MTPQATQSTTNGGNAHGGPRPGAGRPPKSAAPDSAKNAQTRRINEKRSSGGNGSLARVRLLDATRVLLDDSGYESLTVTAVCRGAGLSPQTFYEHFADKRALLAALHGPDVEEIDRRLRKAVAEQSPLAPSLAAALDEALAGLHPSPSAPRARVIAAMIEIAGEQGIEHVTIPELSSKAGVNRGIFYRHFADRTECLAQAHAYCLERIEQELAEVTDESTDPGERTHAAMTHLCERLATSPREARILLVEAGALSGQSRRLADLLADELAKSFPNSQEATRRIAAGAATSFLRAELIAAGVHGLADLARDLTFAVLGPIAGPEEALAQTNGAANGQTKSSTTGATAPSKTTPTKEGSA